MDATRPTSLKLEFSTAADITRIGRLFDPAVKDPADPHHFVDKRLKSAFKKAVEAGCAVVLSDAKGDVQVMTVAYHLAAAPDAAPGAAPNAHDYTEFGSTLSLIQGYHSSVPLIAALALREWFKHPPRGKLAAEIRQDNIPSVKVYKDTLGWEAITDTAENAVINGTSWRTIPDETADPSGNTGMKEVPAEAAAMDWYACNDNALRHQAEVVLEALARGGIVNKKTGDFIPVDFSALDKEGLTKPRLEALARGVTSRSALARIAP